MAMMDMSQMIAARGREVAPVLFDNAGPGCARGKCPEGSRGCGRGDSQGDA